MLEFLVNLVEKTQTPPSGTSMDSDFIWDFFKFVTAVGIIPFGVWIVRSHGKLKDDITKAKEDVLVFKEEVAKSYAAKTDMQNLGTQIDTKITNMQNAVTQRIDTMSSNLANMIATVLKTKD